jgi:cytochrome bd-type quinol oxidase subunit 1
MVLEPASVWLYADLSLLFPQFTMGLGWFLVYWKWCALKTGDEKYNQAVRFWAKSFGLNFAVGVVTGIPMEFQFGTNWAGFCRHAGGTIGMPWKECSVMDERLQFVAGG